MAAALALAGALGWGVGDFFGGLAARRLAVLTVLAVSQTIGLVGVLAWALLSRDPYPGSAELAPAAAGGIVAMIGLGALYRGFAIGAMGIVAPISAASPVVPLAVDTSRGDVPSTLQWLGVGFVVAGIVVLSREPQAQDQRRVAAGAGLAIVAALGFGLFFVGIDAGADESAAWAVTAARLAAVPVVVVAALVTATTLVAAATTFGAVGIVAVLSSLYPIVTLVLAWLVLGERLSATKRAGGFVALAGAALVAGG